MKNPAPNHELVELKTTIQRQKNTKPASPYYLTSAQRKYLIHCEGETCYILFAFYVEKATHADGYDYSDHKVAAILGYSERQIRNARRALAKIGWFHKSTFKDKRGVKVVITYLGVEAVRDYKHSLEAAKVTRINSDLFD